MIDRKKIPLKVECPKGRRIQVWVSKANGGADFGTMLTLNKYWKHIGLNSLIHEGHSIFLNWLLANYVAKQIEWDD